MDLVGDGSDEVAKEVAGDPARGLLVQLGEGELGGAVDGDEEVELALLGSDLGDVDVEEADRVALEPERCGLSPSVSGSRLIAVALKAAVQG